MISDRKVWGKTGLPSWKKGKPGSQMEHVINMMQGQGSANLEAKYNGVFHYGKVLPPFKQR